MKVSLLFPPTWHPSQPYLSLPSLTGFLRQGGVSDVSQRDLGIELLDCMLTRAYGMRVYQQLIDLHRRLERTASGETGYGSREHYAKVTESLDRFAYLVERIELAKDTLRGEGFYDLDAYRASLFMIDKWLELISSAYFPTRLTVVDNQFGDYSIYSSKDLLKVVCDEARNPYRSLMREMFLPSIIGDGPDLIGVSITATSQIIPGLTLCKLIKEAAPDLHVTIGGSIFTRLVDNVRRCPRLFELADDIVVFEGETALLELINQLAGKKEYSKVPNLIHRQNGKITVNQPFYSENVNRLPAPNYDGFPLDRYLSPEPVLPIQFSRGCYYKDCAFCALTLDHQNFRQKDPERTIDELTWLKQRYGARHFFFTDECFALAPTRRLCRQMIEKRLDVKWTCEMRFEKNLTRDLLALMRDAGCLKIVFGLESFNQRVMDLMKKGIKQEWVRRIVDDCVDLGIAVHCYIIVGFPTETEDEALETMNFIVENRRLYESFGFSCQPCLFDLEKEAPIMSDPAEYGIRRIMRPSSEDLSLGFFYEVQSGMTPDQAQTVYQYVYERISEVVCELPFNYSMADGLLYIGRAKEAGIQTPQPIGP
ncbi:MAG: B12-binding domain-containing radical SAM protein [Nitrospira sp.]|nr:B12-binding domain-containing radical SAM protein [Nitrospira sp.]MCP9442346.1 B12-binding domain-containing radical SAM protein [Nitrospira sp.]